MAKEAGCKPGKPGEPRLCSWDGCKVEILPVAFRGDGTPIFLGKFCDFHIAAEKERLDAAEKAAGLERKREALKLEWEGLWGGVGSDYHKTKAELLPKPASSRALLALSLSESVYAWGDSGAGKTRTIYLHGLAWLRKEWRCPMFRRAIELRHEIASAARRDEDSRERLMSRLKNASLLIIDDIGHMASTPAGAEAMLEIVEWRQSMRKPLWITSQRPIEGLADTFPHPTGDAIARRLGQMCRVIDFSKGGATTATS